MGIICLEPRFTVLKKSFFGKLSLKEKPESEKDYTIILEDANMLP